jgi:NAD(P)-dependent dehydrogenase (short-subunit alcohol dehydrogenase family)
MPQKLAGGLVVIIGGSSGIGLASAKRLLCEGPRTDLMAETEEDELV